MYAADLVELAAFVADHAAGLIETGRPLPDQALVDYWSASKCRLQRWSKSLKQIAAPAAADISSERASAASDFAADDAVTNVVSAVLAEILTSEVLTRVWAAAATAHDRRRATGDVEPIVRSVYAGHLEARNRTLVVLTRGAGVGPREAVALNHLRRRAERWADLLLGRLLLRADVAEFAFDADRAREFAHDFRGQQSWQRGGQAWSLAMASLRASFRGDTLTTGNESLNAQIASAIVGCFGGELFDSTGVPRARALEPFSLHDGGCGMVEQLFRSQRDAPSEADLMGRVTRRR